MRAILLVAFGICLSGLTAQSDYVVPSVLQNNTSVQIYASDSEYPHFKHRVKSKETLYSIAKAYGTPMKDILESNIGLTPGGISPGEQIIIPWSKNKFVLRRNVEGASSPSAAVELRFTVGTSQTLYHIAHRLFEVPLYEIMYINDLADSHISPGDQIIIGHILLDDPEPMVSIEEPVPPYPIMAAPPQSGNSSLATHTEVITTDGTIREKPMELVEHKGAAWWNRSQGNRKGLFVLSSEIAAGTEIELFNPMSRRSVFATVVGPIPQGIYSDEIIAIVSPEVAENLRVMDQRFYLHMRYLR